MELVRKSFKQFGMSACAGKKTGSVFNTVGKEPVRGYVQFPEACPLTKQVVIPETLLEWTVILGEHDDNIKKLGKITIAAAYFFDVALEGIRILD